MAGAKREYWGTRVGVILAVAGSAVGLGNFLRFPGNAAQNGGGAFMIPYFISMIILGIPLAWAEWGMGRYGGRTGYNSAPGILGALGGARGWRYAGGLALLIPLVIYMYYVLIEAWCLGYAWEYLRGTIDLGNDRSQYVAKSIEFFNSFVGADKDGMMVSGDLQVSVIFWIIVFALNFIIIYRGVTKGIERFCIYTMPVMALAAFIVLARVLTLPAQDGAEARTVVDGLGYMWNPKPLADGRPWYMALADPKVWLAASGQIFFSLSVGFGIILNYASYVRRNDDVALSGLTAASTNEFFEVCLGGLITIPAAFLFLGAIGIQEAGLSTFGLGFKTLPVVFEYMPAGRFFGFLWFFMLFLAAITSSVSMLQPVIAFLEEGLGLARRASAAILGLITALGSGFVIYFSKDLMALDTFDFWVGTAMIFVLATIQTILFAWVFGVERAYEELQHGAAMRIPRIWCFMVKYISPTYLLLIFAFWCVFSLPDYARNLSKGGVALLSVIVIAVILVFLLLMISIASGRWGPARRLPDTPATPPAEVRL